MEVGDVRRRIESFDMATRTSRGIVASTAGTSVAIPSGRDRSEAASTTTAGAPSGITSAGSKRSATSEGIWSVAW